MSEGKAVYVGPTPWTKDATAERGSGHNPFESIKAAMDAGATGIVIFGQTNFDDWTFGVKLGLHDA